MGVTHMIFCDIFQHLLNVSIIDGWKWNTSGSITSNLFQSAMKMEALLKSSVFPTQKCAGALMNMDRRGKGLGREENQQAAIIPAQVLFIHHTAKLRYIASTS